MNNRHPWPLKKSKSWGPFWSYQLDSRANPAHLPQIWDKWAELAVLQNDPLDYDFFNCCGCQTFILAEIHCYLSALKNLLNNSIKCTEVHFASFLSGGFTAMAVMNPLERLLAKHTSVQSYS